MDAADVPRQRLDLHLDGDGGRGHPHLLGWEITQVYGLTETSPFITICAPLPEHEDMPPADRALIKARQGVELLTSGELRMVDTDGREVPAVSAGV